MATRLAERETLEIPRDVREEVDERDGQFCRVCGKYLGERRALHHIEYGGTGLRRRHVAGNLVTACWLPGDPAPGHTPCHDVVHANKGLWVPILLAVVARPGVTAFQLRRWLVRSTTGADARAAAPGSPGASQRQP